MEYVGDDDKFTTRKNMGVSFISHISLLAFFCLFPVSYETYTDHSDISAVSFAYFNVNSRFVVIKQNYVIGLK